MGVRASVHPATLGSLSMEVAVIAGMLNPIGDNMVLDGYTPFENDFALKRLTLGVAWSGRR